MIEYDRFIYLDVYRTGSTHVLKLLREMMGKKAVRFHRHSSLTRGRRLGTTGGKLVFTTVRNPWDWYVSLWSFGVQGNSAIRRYLAAHLPAAEVERLYDSTNPVESFRRWLEAINDASVLDRIMGEHLPQSGLASVMGLYSYRFLRVTTRYPRLLLRRRFIGSAEAASGHLRRFGAYTLALRTETLDQDLTRLASEHGQRCGFPSDAEERIKAASFKPSNPSVRLLDGYREFYDGKTSALVEARDPLFAEVFGYRF